MGHIPDRIARVQNITYTDEWNRPAILSSDELAFFAETVCKVLAATGISIDVWTRDHEEIPGHVDALGIHYRNAAGDEFITIDNYFIHERYGAEVLGGISIEAHTLAEVICHELAHIRYQRHTRHHAALTAHYVAMLA